MKKKTGLNGLKRITSAVMLLMLFFCLMSGSVSGVSAYGADVLPLDVVIAIDAGESMQTADKELFAREACAIFTGLCDFENTRIGFTSYTDVQEYALDLTSLKTTENREEVYSWINSWTRYTDRESDFLAGLDCAVRLLEDGGSLDGMHDSVIILLSAGSGGTEPGNVQKGVSDPEADLQDNLTLLQKNNVKVYTIELSSDITENADQTLMTISGTTGGDYNRLLSASQLVPAFSSIYSDLSGVLFQDLDSVPGSGAEQGIEITVPAGSVYESIIILRSGQGITDVHLFAPDGTEIDPASDAAAVITYDLDAAEKFTLIKLNHPAEGNWQVQFTTVQGDMVRVKLAHNYDMILSLEVFPQTEGTGGQTGEESEIIRGEEVGIRACFTGPQGVIEDSRLYRDVQGYLRIRRTDADSEFQEAEGMPSAEELLLLNPAETGMETSYVFAEAGEYTLKAVVIGEDESLVLTASLQMKAEPALQERESVTVGLEFLSGTNPVTEVERGDTMDISVRLYSDGEPLLNSEAFEGAQGSLVIERLQDTQDISSSDQENSGKPEKAQMALKNNGDELTGSLKMDKPGEYRFSAEVVWQEIPVTHTDTADITVKALPLTRIRPEEAESVFLLVPLGGIRFMDRKSIDLHDYFQLESGSVLSVDQQTADGQAQELPVSLDFDPETNILLLSAESGGQAELPLIVRNSDGDYGSVLLKIISVPLWLVLAAAAVVIVLVILLVRGIRHAAKPMLNGRLMIRLMPPSPEDTPQELEVDLGELHTKKKVSFWQIINCNDTLAGQYKSVLRPVESFVNNLHFLAGDHMGQKLLMQIPKVMKPDQIQIDNDGSRRTGKRALMRNVPVLLDLYRDDKRYGFIFVYNEKEQVESDIGKTGMMAGDL